MTYKRGDIVIVDLPPVKGSIQHGERPCLVVQNNVGNRYSPVIIVVPLTTQEKNILPTHVNFTRSNGKQNTILCEQIMTVLKTDILNKHENVKSQVMSKVDKSLKVSLGIR